MTRLSGRIFQFVAASLFAAIATGCGGTSDAQPGGQAAMSGKQQPAAKKLAPAVEAGKSDDGKSPTSTATEVASKDDERDPSPIDTNAAPGGDSSASVGESRRPVARHDSKPKQEIIEGKLPEDPDSLDAAVMPLFNMSKEQADACLIKPGDTFPSFSLPDATDSKAKKLADVSGKALTVVIVWDAEHPYALDELSEISGQVGQRFAAQGVSLVGINVGDSADIAKQSVSKTGAHFAALSDAKGELKTKLAKDAKLPRTYLLDAKGKVLWMDNEYSRFTRRQLKQAIRASL